MNNIDGHIWKIFNKECNKNVSQTIVRNEQRKNEYYCNLVALNFCMRKKKQPKIKWSTMNFTVVVFIFGQFIFFFFLLGLWLIYVNEITWDDFEMRKQSKPHARCKIPWTKKNPNEFKQTNERNAIREQWWKKNNQNRKMQCIGDILC